MEQFYLYLIPVICFFVVWYLGTFIKKEPGKDPKEPGKDPKDTNTIDILIKMLPAVLISAIVFVVIKYRDNFFVNEPVMQGNYFD